jgi:hypothetical protein
MNNTSEGRVKLEKKTRKSKKKGENRKQKIPKKRRALSTRERGQP